MRLFKKLGRKGLLWIYRRYETARFDGIILVDWADTPHFTRIITAALKLIKEMIRGDFVAFSAKFDLWLAAPAHLAAEHISATRKPANLIS